MWRITGVIILAHLAAAVALVAFGWRAGGYPLHGLASYIYLTLTLVAGFAFIFTWRRTGEWVEAARIGLPAWLGLVVAGVWFATSNFGAKYATWGALTGDEGLFALVNLAYTLLGCGLALGLRWPKLLLTWVLAHGSVLVLSLGVWSNALRYGALVPNPPEALPWLFLPLVYGMAALALGWRPSQQTAQRIGLFALVGLIIAGLGALNLARYLASHDFPLTDLWSNLVIGAPEVIWFTAMVLPLGWYAWRARREWDADAFERPFSTPAWLGVIFSTLFGALIAGYLLSPMMLPRAGEVQAWISQSHIVPANAWLPTLAWSAWLFVAVRWLLIPLALLGALSWWTERRTFAITSTTWLLWLALAAWLAIALNTLTPIRFIPGVISHGFSRLGSFFGSALPVDALLLLFGVGFGLLCAARAWERALSSRRRPGLMLLTFALLGLFLWLQLAFAEPFARFLFFPLPVWAAVAEYASASPALLAALGLSLHVALFVFGLAVAVRWITIARQQWRGSVEFLPTLRRLALISGSSALIVYAGWYALTAPRVVRVVPAPGATNVPRDTWVLIEFPAPNGLETLLAGGFGSGLDTHYADTGEYIPGVTAMGPGGLTFDPEGLLRPGAPVEIIARWANKRPYVLHFTTGGPDAPSATPLPYSTDWMLPAPTALLVTTPAP
jgi:hypothetical protein